MCNTHSNICEFLVRNFVTHLIICAMYRVISAIAIISSKFVISIRWYRQRYSMRMFLKYLQILVEACIILEDVDAFFNMCNNVDNSCGWWLQCFKCSILHYATLCSSKLWQNVIGRERVDKMLYVKRDEVKNGEGGGQVNSGCSVIVVCNSNNRCAQRCCFLFLSILISESALKMSTFSCRSIYTSIDQIGRICVSFIWEKEPVHLRSLGYRRDLGQKNKPIEMLFI